MGERSRVCSKCTNNSKNAGFEIVERKFSNEPRTNSEARRVFDVLIGEFILVQYAELRRKEEGDHSYL